MPAPLIPAILAGLRALTTRAAAGFVARGVAAEGVEAAVGKKLVSNFIESKVAPKALRVFRGVSEAALSNEFAAPVPGAAPVMKTYQSSFAAAKEAAGQGGRVLQMNLPRENLAAYSPSPMEGGGTKFSVPFAEHFQAARRAATVNAAMRTPLGRVARTRLDFPPAPKQQRAVQARSHDYAGPTSSTSSASATPVQGSSPRQWPDSMRQAGTRAVSAVRNWMTGSSRPNTNYKERRWSAGIRNLLNSATNGSSWRPSPPPSGPAPVQPGQGGGPSFPHISPSNLIGMAGQPQHQIGQVNANNGQHAQWAAQQQRAQQQLVNSTQLLSNAFKALLGPAGKAATAAGSTLTSAIAYTGATGAAVNSKIDRLGEIHPGFAGMSAQRFRQDLILNRSLANATEPSARYLNDTQMEGKEQLARMWEKAEPLLNHLAGAGQRVVNVVLRIADKVLLLDHLETLDNALQKLLGIEEQKKNEKSQNTPHMILDEARRGATMGDKRKAPLNPIR